ncbi:MAG: aspartate ammonia-lyase [Bacteroidetes bacterium]|nr:aspartate ammonia-lyase [Bacteroidota bacterium]MBU1578985.1 aspartate ammonia-lyase [Bacteroidota bacterium]MBU2465047.1 aspartate ammonia-lyase [Bacteroidota bacterium]MBU2558296.1 aspartate ammonia-lyase [Bacteroidota bacterium]
MELIDKVLLIKHIELFKGLSEEELAFIAGHTQEVKFGTNALLFEENTSRELIFLIVSGKIELFKTTAFGEEQIITYFGRHDFLGEGSLMEDSPHSTSARAKEESHVLTLSKAVFKTSGAIALAIFSNITRVVSRRMRYANTKALNITTQYESGKTRKEHDLLGERDVPYEYYYGVQTLRALENFNISGITLNFFPDLVKSLAMVKMAAAKANLELKLLPDEMAKAIIQACQEIMNNRFLSQFVVDMIQGGAGTSTNMNANEVIANRALEILGKERGQYEFCHPNNHVNLSQSTNDAYPTAIKIALIKANEKLVDVLQQMIAVLHQKGREFAKVIKMGRTQLQDAVPMTLGQTFEAFAVTMEEEVQQLNRSAALFLEVNMGGTAIGTGINADPQYSEKVIPHLRLITGMDIRLARNLVEATQDTGDFVTYSGSLKRLATKLSKTSNDLRLLSSGPRAGLNEINLPPMQPGSTIMPGKVNPVIPEVVNQIAFKVIGNDLTVALAAEAGQLELNVMEPVIVQSLFESIEMLKNGMKVLSHRCIAGITANEAHCRHTVLHSIGLVTALNPFIGYEASTLIAKEALETGASVYELVLEKGLLSKAELDKILAPENMIH